MSCLCLDLLIYYNCMYNLKATAGQDKTLVSYGLTNEID